MVKSYTKDYFVDRKLKWEKNHGKFIHEFMFNEYQTRIIGQCNTALNDLQRQLDLEIARAKAEEHRIEVKAHDELGKVYDFINPSSTAYEDVLTSTEPLKYTELAHADGDFLAENGQKDLNSAYNRTMTVLTDAFNSLKNNPEFIKAIEHFNITSEPHSEWNQESRYQYNLLTADKEANGKINKFFINTSENNFFYYAFNQSMNNICNYLQYLLDKNNNLNDTNNFTIEEDGGDYLKVVQNPENDFSKSYENVVNSLVRYFNAVMGALHTVIDKNEELVGKTADLMHKQQALENRIVALESKETK